MALAWRYLHTVKTGVGQYVHHQMSKLALLFFGPGLATLQMMQGYTETGRYITLLKYIKHAVQKNINNFTFKKYIYYTLRPLIFLKLANCAVVSGGAIYTTGLSAPLD